MSVFLDIAEDMKTAIEAVIPSSDLAVIVDSQTDLASEFRKYISKVKGGVAIIEYLSAPNTDKHANPPIFSGKYAVTLFASKILKKDGTPLADLLDTICRTLQHWGGNMNYAHYSEAQISNPRLIKDPHFLIYTVDVSKDFQL